MQRSLSAALIALLLVFGLVTPAGAQQAEPPGPPTNLRVQAAEGAFQLRWDPPAEGGPLAQYRVEQSDDGEQWILVGETTSTTFTVAEPLPGVQSFRVRAEGPGGPSDWATVEVAARERANVLQWIRDIDWSRLAQDMPRFLSNANDTEASSRTREALRQRAAGGDGRQLMRASAGTEQWWDTCNDVTTRPATWAQEGSILEGTEQPGTPVSGRLDLRSTTIVREGDQHGFLGYTCRPWASPDLGDGAMVWALYTNDDVEIPMFLVVLYQDRGQLKGMVVRTPNSDPRSWYATWMADAKRLDDHAVDLVIPDKAIGGADTFQFEWAVIDGAGREDLFPERSVARGETEFDQPTARAFIPEDEDVPDFRPNTGLPRWPNPCDPGGSYLGQIDRTWSPPVPAGQPDNGWAVAATGPPSPQLSQGVRVAVLDDGVAPRNGLPGSRVAAGYDAAFNRPIPAGADSDRGGHGTAAAGLMAAATQSGMTGLNVGTIVVPIRVVDANQCTNEDALALGVWSAIDRAVAERGQATDLRPWVILIPLAGPVPGGPRGRLSDAISVAQSLGMSVIAAAGNDIEQVRFPAGQPGVVAVGSLTRDGRRASYSPSHRMLDIVAPGGEGRGTADRDIVSLWELGQLRPQFGTGLSAALVAGAVAGYRARWPEASPGAVRAALEVSARDRGAPGHDPDFGYGELDVARLLGTPPGVDPARGLLQRVDEAHPAGVATEISRRRFPQGGARHAVLARHDLFADALAGAPLTAQGPLLLSGQSVLPEQTEHELRRVLAAGGKVYVLGGHEAIGPEVEAHVAALGFSPHRLAGPTRIDTALAVAEEVRALYPGRATVALARAFGRTPDDTAAWADAVSVGAWAAATRTPVLVTGSDRLAPQVAARLQGWGIQRTVLLGGGAALSAAVEQAVPGPMRIAGPDRAATAAAVAGNLWDGPRQVLVFNGYIGSGWAFGLSAAGLAADRNAPLVMVDHQVLPEATRSRVASMCPGPGGVTLIGSDQVIGGSVESGLAGAAAC